MLPYVSSTSLSLSPSLSLSLSPSLSLYLSQVTHPHFFILRLSLSVCVGSCHTHSLSLFLSISHTHTHTHTNFLNLSVFPISVTYHEIFAHIYSIALAFSGTTSELPLIGLPNIIRIANFLNYLKKPAT